MAGPGMTTVSCPRRLVLLLLLLKTIVSGSNESNSDGLLMGPVFIYEPPNSVDFSNSSGAAVECSAHGNPQPKVRWVLSDAARPVANVSRLRHVLPNATLTFPPFVADHYQPDVHSAVYRCQARSPLGTIISRAVHVRAVVLQAYDAQVYDEYVIRGNTAVLKCQIPSFVADYVIVTSWVRDSVVTIEHNIHSDSKFVVLPSGELYINEVTSEESSHTYHCRTVHLLTGQTKLSATAGRLVVTDSNGSVPPRITDSRSIVQAKERETAILACAAQGHPLPVYSWFHKVDSGQYVDVSTSLRIRQTGGLLIIEQAQASDAATYVCTASNSLGSEKAETTLVINVPLSVHIEPPQQVLDRGKSTTFTCVVSGYPTSSVTWRKNGMVVDQKLSLQKEVLHITSVSREDVGMYQCFVSNSVETVQSTAELRLGDSSPEIFSGFDDQILHPGTSLSLKCAAVGIPLPQISWAIDSVLLTMNDRIRTGEFTDENGNLVSHLNISRLLVEDGGRYTCTARNKAGIVEYTASVTVYGNPFIRHMPKVTAVAGEDMSIRCPASGHPIDAILWEKDGSRLPTNHRQKVYQNGTMHVLNVQRMQDTGKYTCVARNKNGQSARRDVEVAVLVPPKIIPFSFQEDQTYEGVRASVFCSLSQGDLPLTIQWLKDGALIPPTTDVSTHGIDKYASTLVIERVVAKHSGNYTCSAKNAAATVNHTAQLIVNVPPRWKVEPVDTSVFLGNNIQINCQAEGHPSATISWFKSLDVTSGDFIELNAGLHAPYFDHGKLHITAVTEHDEAYYMCKATNNVGSGLSKVIFLNVNVPARIEQKNRNETAKMGEMANLTCDAVGDLPIHFTWSVSTEPTSVISNKRYSVFDRPSDVGMTSVLRISQTGRSDSQTFSCSAKNPFGQDDGIINLIVQELPEPPKNIILKEAGSRSVHLTWNHPYDGNIPVKGYVVQYSPGDWQSNIFNVSIPSSDTSIVIHDLHPATNYHFRMLAVNNLGISNPSVEKSITTGEEAPSGPPKDVKVEAINSHTLRVIWKPPRKDLWNGDIQGYHVGYRMYNLSEPYNFQTLSVTDGSHARLVVVIEKLKKYTKYSVVVQAYNNHGIGPNSEEVVAMTLEDVPSSSPSSVKCSGVSSQSLHVVWEPPPPNDINGLLQGYKVLYRPVREWYGQYDGFETKITSALKTMLHGLEKYTNYSVHVLAFTHVGDGVKSAPVFCTTMEDVPSPPGDIKVLTSGLDAIMVSWREPASPNGVITKYTVYIRSTESGREETTKVSVPGNVLHYEAKGLSKKRRYEFWVTASSNIGEGQSTSVAAQTTGGPLVAAKVVSFGKSFVTAWKETVHLPCTFVGTPAPSIKWSFGGDEIQPNARIFYHQEGTLVLHDIHQSDSGNYTCSVQNRLAADNITHQVIVEVPPEPPVLTILSTTTASLQLGWALPSGITSQHGYTLSYRQDYGQWSELMLGPYVQSHTIHGLACGTRYQVYITAHNKIGRGSPSEILTVKTKGEAPQTPTKEKLISENSTYITLYFDSWFDGGCPILYFVVEYRHRNSPDWILVSNNVKPDNKRSVITDLSPGEAYQLRVTAHSSAGSDSAQYDFTTLSQFSEANGSAREIAIHSNDGPFAFLDVTIIVSTVATLVIVIAAISLACMCARRHKTAHHNVTEKIKPEYQSVSPSIIESLEKKYLSEPPPRGENGMVCGSSHPMLQTTDIFANELQDVSPYATFQIAKAETDATTPTIDYYIYNSVPTNTNSSNKYSSRNNYNDCSKKTINRCPRHSLGNNESEVPDLLEHGADSTSSEESSPHLHHRPLQADNLCKHPDDPRTVVFPVAVNRNSHINTAETTFIFPRRKDGTCLYNDRDRVNMYKTQDSNAMQPMNLY